MKESNFSQLGDYDVPFCEQQYTHGSCYISLFKFKSFYQLIPPKLPQILDIYSVVALYRVPKHFVISFVFAKLRFQYGYECERSNANNYEPKLDKTDKSS